MDSSSESIALINFGNGNAETAVLLKAGAFSAGYLLLFRVGPSYTMK